MGLPWQPYTIEYIDKPWLPAWGVWELYPVAVSDPSCIMVQLILLWLLWLSQLQLNDVMLLLHCVFMSPILLRLNACVQCVGCLQGLM